MTQTQYYSTNRAQWHSSDASYRKAQANQNMKPMEIVRHVSGSTLTQRINVLAQILSPTGRVHIHHKVPLKTACLSRTICWHFPDKAE
jgi:hypothetical protein